MVKPLAANALKGWRFVDQDGVEHDFSYFRLVQESLGMELEYGQSPKGGYDQFIINLGTGGVVVVPVVQLENGDVLIGGVVQTRPLMSDQKQFQAIRGFIEPGLTISQAACLELAEETGISVSPSSLVCVMGGEGKIGMNENTAFINTNPNLGATSSGIHVFTCQLEPSMLEYVGDVWEVRGSGFPTHPKHHPSELIDRAIFVPFDLLHLSTPCAISQAAWGRTYAYWASRGMIT